MNVKNSRSTLLNHCFPPFYACYLLKSIRTPTSIATYIGSTPSPPRRIRQHNGELTQGAVRTQNGRPWVMQMLVHGFPSKLAALQFEWAWQHPYISRHLRDEDGRKVFQSKRGSMRIRPAIKVAHSMVLSHPFNTWPLHVKLFTEEATKIWRELITKSGALPKGMTYTVELEGVDGKSDNPGSGRSGPIDVTDAQFTSSHLAKARRLNGQPLTCAVCNGPIENFASAPLEHGLCPTDSCTSVAHLKCLSSHFLASPSTSTAELLIPRGGDCPSCNTYILWGDVIRGCYRRHKNGAEVIEDDEPMEQDDSEGENEQEIPLATQTKKRGRPKGSGKMTGKKAAKAKGVREQSPEGEVFDLSAIGSSDSDSQEIVMPPPPKLRKRTATASKTPQSPKTRPKAMTPGADLLNQSKSDSEVSSRSSSRIVRTKAKSPIKTASKQTRKRTPSSDGGSDVDIVDALSMLSVSSDGELPAPRKPPSPPKKKRAREYIELSD